MTKSQLIKKVAEELKLDERKARELVDGIFNSIVEVLMEKKRIEMRGFGVFRLSRLKGVFITNPRNGIEMFIGARYTIRFKPSKRLVKAVNEKQKRIRRVFNPHSGI